MHRRYRLVWFEPKYVPKKSLLTGPKFNLNTSSSFPVTKKSLKEEVYTPACSKA